MYTMFCEVIMVLMNSQEKLTQIMEIEHYI